MNKVIRVNDEIVVIGTDNGGILEVRKDDLDFEPVIGDVVDVFTSETSVIVTKKEVEAAAGINTDKAGINITIQNENASNNSGVTAGPTGKVVNKIAYVVLAILLGDIGVHKFYAGKIGLGIVYLIFCWTAIPAVIGLIEGIIAAFKPADQNGNIVV